MTVEQLKQDPLFAEALEFVYQRFVSTENKNLCYHNYDHTKGVIDMVVLIGEKAGVSDHEVKLMGFAALFHDLGYMEQKEGHEKISASIAREWLGQRDFPEDDIVIVEKCILATQLGVDWNDFSKLELIMMDADLAHLGTSQCFEQSQKLYEEMKSTGETEMTDKEWVKMNHEFISNHQFKTQEAADLFQNQKFKNIGKLEEKIQSMEAKKDKPKKDKKEKNRFGRGVETMFRVSLRNHNNLSSIADSKANIMLSITAIMLSLILSTLAPKLDNNGELIIPTIILITVCISSMFFAILATRPKVTKQNFSRDAFLDSKVNLLFFGNFQGMSLEEFEWGLDTLMHDDKMLYSSLSKDLFFLGKVLARKYRYLRICYTIFMVGSIISALAFIIAFTTNA